MDVFDLYAKIELDTKGYERGINDAAKSTGKTSTLMQTALNAVSVAAGNMLTRLAEAAVEMVSTIAETGLEFNRQMENYQLAFENLLGSAEAANDALDAIKSDAASTPFDVAGLVSANRLLISTGQSAEEARQVITALGNAVSASGGGNDELQRMAANLQQIANVGKATAVDVRQFAYAGIDIYGLLADYTGLAKDEVQDLTVSYDLLVDALEAASAEGGRYAGAMEAYSQTLQGRMDTLADNATQLAGAITETLFDAQKDFVEAASGWVDTLAETLEAEGPGAMMAAGVQIVFELAQGIAEAAPQVASAAVQTVADFAANVLQNLPAIANTGGQIIGSLIAGLLGLMVNLESAVGQIVAAIIDFFLSGDFIDVGVQIISGVIQGFVDALPNLVNTVINAVGDLVESAKQVARDGWNAVQSIMSGEAVADVGASIDKAANPYHRGSVKDEDYWKQVGAHYTTTGQDQKGGDYTPAAEKNTRSTYDFSAALDSLSTSAGKAAKQTETLADKLDDAHSALTASQSAYNTLSDAIDEYNESGQISIGTWQDLMELAPEYQNLLTEEGGKLKINTEAYANLSAAQRLEIETLALQNGTTADTIQLFDKLLEKTDAVGTAFDKLKKGISGLIEGGPLEIVNNLVNAFKSGNLSSIAEALGEGIWATITPEQQNAIYNWSVQAIQTMNTAFSTDGWTGLLDAGATIAQGLADGIKNNDSIFLEAAQTVIDSLSGLANSALSKIGISGGVEGLISIIMELGPIVLGVVAAVAAVAAGVAGVAAAFSYTVDQSKALQAQIQALTEDGQELTDELSAALEVLQPIMDQIDGMLSQLDRVTSMFSDTFAGIGVEIMETMIPIIQQILNIILPALENLQPALEAVGDLLRTLLELFGNLVSSVLTALQPILEAIGPLLETLAEILNSIASVVSAVLSPALKALGELLNWLLQPILWVAQAINNAVEWIVSLINPLLKFLGLGTISLPDNSAINKGNAISSIGSSVGDYVTPSTSTGTSSGGTTIQKVEIYIDGAQYQDPESLAEAISIQLQNLTERKVNVFA